MVKEPFQLALLIALVLRPADVYIERHASYTLPSTLPQLLPLILRTHSDILETYARRTDAPGDWYSPCVLDCGGNMLNQKS